MLDLHFLLNFTFYLKAWQYAASKKSMISVKSDDGKYVYFYVFAGDNMDKITVKDVDKFTKQISVMWNS